MKAVYSCSLCTATVFAFGMAVFAQATPQQSATKNLPGDQQTATDQQVTVMVITRVGSPWP